MNNRPPYIKARYPQSRSKEGELESCSGVFLCTWCIICSAYLIRQLQIGYYPTLQCIDTIQWRSCQGLWHEREYWCLSLFDSTHLLGHSQPLSLNLFKYIFLSLTVNHHAPIFLKPPPDLYFLFTTKSSILISHHLYLILKFLIRCKIGQWSKLLHAQTSFKHKF